MRLKATSFPGPLPWKPRKKPWERDSAQGRSVDGLTVYQLLRSIHFPLVHVINQVLLRHDGLKGIATIIFIRYGWFGHRVGD